MSSAGGDDEGSGQSDWMRSGLNADQSRRSRMFRTVGALSAAGVIGVGTLVVFQSTRVGDDGFAGDPGPPAATRTTTTGDSPNPSVSASRTPPSSPAMPYIDAGPSGEYVPVLDLPRLDATVLGWLPHGTAVSIVCTTVGEVVRSPYGVDSDLWDYIDATDLAPGGYVPDSWVNTGTDEPTRPFCS